MSVGAAERPDYYDDDGLAEQRALWWTHLKSYTGTEHGGALVVKATHGHISRCRGRGGKDVLRYHGSFLVACRACTTTRVVQAENVLENRPTQCRSERCRTLQSMAEVVPHATWTPHGGTQ